MDRYTRHELKQDEFQETLDSLQVFVSEHLRQIVLIGAAVLIVAGIAIGLKTYYAHQEAAANAELQNALTTFNAYVSASPQNNLIPSEQTFSTAKAKYEKALSQFSAIASGYPRTKAAGYARIHEAICQAQLGNQAAAIQSLRQLSRNSDKAIASQAQFTLAGQLAETGKTAEAAKLYQDLADHPTTVVPRATALLALANTIRATEPNRAREIYSQMQTEFASDSMIVEGLKQQMASLPSGNAAPPAQ